MTHVLDTNSYSCPKVEAATHTELSVCLIYIKLRSRYIVISPNQTLLLYR